MENPMTWSPTEILLMEALYDGPDPGLSVIQALKKANLLKESSAVLDNALIWIVNTEHKRHQNMVATGFCGRSLGGIINELLAKLGAI
jgi:hypothetical protein